MTPEALAELRRMADAATPRPWEWTANLDALLGGEEGEYSVIDTALAFRSYYVLRVAGEDAALIAAAVNALPALLDAAAERDALRAERDALAEAVERVRALHRRETRWGNEDYSIDAEEYAERKAENDEVDAGWALDDLAAVDVCAECYRVEQSIEQRDDGVAALEGLWPCPTVRTLDGEARP